MSNDAYDKLIDEYNDILPTLSKKQAQELRAYVESGDLESAHYYLSYLAKVWDRIPVKPMEYEHEL